MNAQPAAGGIGLDLRAILASLSPLIWYTGMVIMATLGGYPGVVCITPMAWLIGLWAGQRVVANTRSAPPRRPLVEAALAGAVVGLVTGVLFVIVGTQMPPADAEEVGQMLGFTTCIVVLGIPISAGLAVLTGWLTQRRRWAGN